MKKMQAKARKGIFNTGVAGCGNSGSSEPIDKRNKDEKQCDFCDRIFKQMDRLKMHVQKHHPQELQEQAAEKTAAAEQEAKDKPKESANGGPVRATQKNPKTIFHEWCQKHKVPLPRYQPRDAPDNKQGFICKIVMPDKHKPDSDVVMWMNDVAGNKEEAMQQGAVMALARLTSNLPLERLLPSRYLPLWEKQLAFEKDRAARKERDREAAERAKKHKKKAPTLQSVYMSEEKRRLVEGVLKGLRDDNTNDDAALSAGAEAAGAADAPCEELVSRLAAMGFKDLHIHDALAQPQNKTVNAALDWLMIHVADSELPEQFAPGAAGEPIGIRKLAGATREHYLGVYVLEGYGYTTSACKQAMEETEGDEVAALMRLFRAEVLRTIPGLWDDWPCASAAGDEPEEWEREDGALDEATAWEEERVAIEAIFADDATFPSDTSCVVAQRVSLDDGSSAEPPMQLALGVQLPEGSAYPRAPPLITVTCQALPPGEVLHLTKQLAALAAEMRGSPCVHHLVTSAPELAKEAIRKTRLANRSARSAAKPARASEAGSINKSPSNGVEQETRTILPMAKQVPPSAPVSATPSASNENRERAARPRASVNGSQVDTEASLAFQRSESARLSQATESWLSRGGVAAEMRATRSSLPAAGARASVVQAVNSHSVVVINGETGCGKSTQVPQFLLEEMIAAGRGGEANIVVTQPRRISAMSLAERVSSERAERCGEVVGYAVRLDACRSQRTRLLFCTTGILLRRLLADAALTSVSHIVLDEVHERSLESDLLLLLLRSVLAKRANLKVVLMSATAEAGLFQEYFQQFGCMTLTIPGFTYPVQEYFLHDVLECTGVAIGKASRWAKKGSNAKLKPKTTDANNNAHLRFEGDDDEAAVSERTSERGALRGGASSASLAESGGSRASIAQREEDVPDEWDAASSASEDGRDDTGAEDGADESTESAAALPPRAPAPARGASPPPCIKPAWSEDPSAAVRAMNAPKTDVERNTMLALAESVEAGCSLQTQRSLQNVDENLLNYELIENLVAYILRTERTHGVQALIGRQPGQSKLKDGELGAVLVFLPGMAEIRKCARYLENSMRLDEQDAASLWVLPLHGSLAAKEQKLVFQKPPKGVRKVVLATNVAETSITIDDVVYVIDSGRHKEMMYHSDKGLAALEDAWVSRASARQRRGRAGRVQAGACFHIFSQRQHALMEAQQLPEMLRVPLESLCLQVKQILGGSVMEQLSAAITPPDPASILYALKKLRDLAALDKEENLTPLGQHLVRMPVDARIGKMLVFGAMLGCLDTILSIAGSMSGRGVFVSPRDDQDKKTANSIRLALSKGSKSDHLASVAAYNQWIKAGEKGYGAQRRFCEENFISMQAMETVEASRVDYASALADLGFIPQDVLKFVKRRDRSGTQHPEARAVLYANESNSRIIKAVLCAGFYPNVVRVKHPEAKYVKTEGGAVLKEAAGHQLKMYAQDVGRVFLHPSSVNFHVGRYESNWLIYSERVQTGKVFVREVTMVPTYSLLLFGGSIEVLHQEKMVTVDNWVRFEAPGKIAVLFRELRAEVDKLLVEKIRQPQMDLFKAPAVDVMLKLLATDGI